MKPLKLKEIVEKLEEIDEEWLGFLNIETGEIVIASSDYLGIAEESEKDDDFSQYRGWERDLINQAMDVVVHWNQYKKLPDKSEINEYSIMEAFSYSHPSESISERLSDAIHGKGAFRRFKDMLDRFDITDEWYAFREKALIRTAQEWCKSHEIPFDI